jgi:hypothetical protein
MKHVLGFILLALATLSAFAEDWAREVKDRSKRGSLLAAAQLIRGDSGKWSEEARLQLAPPISRKPAKMTLDAWADLLVKEKARVDDSEEAWLLFRTVQLDDNDRVWVERIERKGNKLNIVACQARWQGKYFRNFTKHHLLGVSLGKLEPGAYEVTWSVRPMVFTKFEGDGKPADANWPADEKPGKGKAEELRQTFTVEKRER